MRAPRRARPAPGPSKTIEDLRPLLVGPEQSRIQRVEQRLDEHLSEMVAEVLPETVVKSRARGDALAWALAPLLETSIRDVVRRDPAGFAESIAPALGPSLREAVRVALRAALQRLDVLLEQSLTFRSVRWRIEALRTGRAFSEVVLLRTLVYQVEQVFLIHRATGLVLEHVSADQIPVRDPDQVAAMLSAIETFVSEAFHEEKARLEHFRVGDLTGWVEHGPEALLVAVVRGAAPEDYEGALRQTLDRVHLERAADLADFRGAPEPFVTTRDLLVDCLRESRRKRRPTWMAPFVAAVALAAIPAILVARDVRAERQAERRLATYADTLRREPGLVLIEAERSGGRFLLAGLRDPLAKDPAAVLARAGLDPGAAILRFDPFYSLDARLAERRAAALLHPPESVSLSLRDGELVASGTAPARWIERAELVATSLPGVSAFADDRLYAEESIARERAAVRALASAEVLFDLGSASLTAEERTHLDHIAGEAKRLFEEAPRAGMTAKVMVIGHVDPTGPEAYNRELALARAEGVVAELHARGVDGALSAEGGGVRREVLRAGCQSAEPPLSCGFPQAGRRARSAVIHVDLEPRGAR
jgi:OOP family OmpA-OmpF porin